VVDQLNADDERAGVAHCWEVMQLLRVWERTVQAETAGKTLEGALPQARQGGGRADGGAGGQLDERTCDNAPSE